MFERLIRLAIEHRWLVILAVLAMAGFGIFNYTILPIDAVPDITNVQVQINITAPGYSPLETEQRITYPIETVMAGLPHLEHTRSLSRYGLSQVTVIFKDGTDIYFARQLVNQRIQEAKDKLPPGITPDNGTHLDRSRGNLPVDGRSQRRRPKARRFALHRNRPARDSGLDHQTATAQCARRDRDQFHRRLRQAISGRADPGKAGVLRPDLARHRDRAGSQ